MPDSTERLSIDPRLLQRMKGIEIKSRFLAKGLYNNRHRSTDFGSSNEFIEYRDYQPGDALSTIDWRVYARTDRLYVKRFEMEANMEVHFLLDTSGSMRVQAERGLPGKLELAATIVGAVATMVIAQQDSAGLYCIADGVAVHIPPSQGLRHLSLLFQHLSDPPGSGGGDFGKLAQRPMQEIGRKGVAFVVSDAIDPPEELFETLKGLMVREQDVTLFQILDKAELEFPFDKMTEFRNPETDQRIMGDPLRLKQQYLKRMNSHLQDIEQFCNRTGVDYVRIHNGDDLVNLLASHFIQRLVRGRG